MVKSEKELQSIYDSLSSHNGDIDKNKLLEYIQKNLEMQEEVNKVYDYVTKGLLKKCQYSSETVISVINTVYSKTINKDEACEDILQIVHDEGTQQLILEYFGKS